MKNRQKLKFCWQREAAIHSKRVLFKIASVWSQKKYNFTYVQKIGLMEQAVYAPFSAAILYPLKIVTVKFIKFIKLQMFWSMLKVNIMRLFQVLTTTIHLQKKKRPKNSVAMVKKPLKITGFLRWKKIRKQDLVS